MERQMFITIAWWGMFFYSLALSSCGKLIITITTMTIITSAIGMLMVGTIWGAYIWKPEHDYLSYNKGLDSDQIFLMEFVGCIITGLLFSLFFVEMELLYALFFYYPILIAEGLIIIGSYHKYKTKTT